MRLSDLDLLVPAPIAEPLLKPRWGTVEQPSPLRVRLDGDTAALDQSPTTLVAGLATGDRVWLALVGRQLIVIGRLNDVGVPVGAVLAFAGAAAPLGYLMCSGAAYDPVTYTKLYSLIGTTYGGTAGAPLLPNLMGRVPVGLWAGDSRTNALGKYSGEFDHILTIAEMPSHNHALPVRIAAGGEFDAVAGAGTGTKYTAGMMSNAGGGAAHNIMQPSTVVNYIIKAV